MLLLKDFATIVDVDDPIQFATDADRNALLMVRRQFPRCYQGVYVHEVLEVVRRSPVRMHQVGDLSRGSVSIEFRARCSLLSPGDAYPVVEVRREQQVLMGSGVGEHAKAEPLAVTIVDGNEALPDGCQVPVRILGDPGSIEYPPSLSMPTALATLLTCRTKATAWRVSEGKDGDGAVEAAIDQFWPPLEEALGEKAKIAGDGGPSKVRAFFAKLFHTYIQSEAPDPGQFGAVAFSSRDSVEAWAKNLRPGSGWTRPLDLEYDFEGVAPLADGERADEASPSVLVAAFLTECLQSVALLNTMSRHFHAAGRTIKEQVGVWRIIREAQRRRN